jgi:hypothetical protein
MVLDCIATVHYCTMVVLRIAMWDYTVVSLETFVHYIVVVAENDAQDYMVVVVHFYIMVVAQVVLSYVQHATCMYMKYPLSSSPNFCSPSLCVQLTCKN